MLMRPDVLVGGLSLFLDFCTLLEASQWVTNTVDQFIFIYLFHFNKVMYKEYYNIERVLGFYGTFTHFIGDVVPGFEIHKRPMLYPL